MWGDVPWRDIRLQSRPDHEGVDGGAGQKCDHLSQVLIFFLILILIAELQQIHGFKIKLIG